MRVIPRAVPRLRAPCACVIAFDRPGFGYSHRPRRTVWTPEAQADLIAAALKEIGVSKPMVLGHSWGHWSQSRSLLNIREKSKR
jgi:pimeloyl-ACP methyl ester carboxylesterase